MAKGRFKRRGKNPASTTSSGFNPTLISGLQLWLDADDPTVFTYSSGDVVSQWNDKSANAWHVSQGTVANQPIRNGTQNGRATVVFDGVNDRLARASTALAQPISIFGVVEYTNVDAGNRQWFGNGGTHAAMLTDAGSWSIYAGTLVADGTDDASPHMHMGEFNGASSAYYRDGTQILSGVNPGANGLTILRIGADFNGLNFWQGEIAEIVVYNSVLSAANRLAVEGYLRGKWGTP